MNETKHTPPEAVTEATDEEIESFYPSCWCEPYSPHTSQCDADKWPRIKARISADRARLSEQAARADKFEAESEQKGADLMGAEGTIEALKLELEAADGSARSSLHNLCVANAALAEQAAQLSAERAKNERLLSRNIEKCSQCGCWTSAIYPATAHPEADEVCAACGPVGFELDQSRKRITDLEEAVSRGEAFKQYVHLRLDVMNVPANPQPPKHALEGCRIGDRLDYIENYIKDNAIAILAAGQKESKS